jgi:hypothetical protein
VPQYQAARWSGISTSILSRKLSGESDWLLSELFVFNSEVLGMSLSILLEEAEAII